MSNIVDILAAIAVIFTLLSLIFPLKKHEAYNHIELVLYVATTAGYMLIVAINEFNKSLFSLSVVIIWIILSTDKFIKAINF